MLEGILLENKKTQQELEYTFVGLVRDFNDLEEKAEKIEVYDQWMLGTDGRKNKGKVGGVIRVRGIDNKKFYLTVKESSGERIKGLQNLKESEVEITREMFESFKRLAPRGMTKTRYTIPIPNSNLKWEIDTYITDTGETSDWCKIDLEVKKPLAKLPDFPIEFDSVVDLHSPNADERLYANKIIDSLILKRKDSILPIF